MKPTPTICVMISLLLCAGLVRGAEPAPAAPASADSTTPDAKGAARQARKGAGTLKVDAAKIERDVTYGKAAGTELKLDLYFPRESDGKRLAAAVYVHGGGWQHGDKAQGAGAMVIPEMVRRGYLVASINYRLGPGNFRNGVGKGNGW